MATQALSFVSFNGGEWSPRMYGRFDQPKYPAALKRCENFIPLIQGPVTRRPSTQHQAPTLGNTASVRMIPFVFSSDQTYAIEATPLRFRFYRGGASRGPVVESSKSITAITQANPAVVTANAHGYANDDEVLIDGVVGMVQVNNRRFKVANKTANTFELHDLDGNNVNSSSYTAYSSGGNASRVYTLTTTYTADDLPLLSFDQSKDVLYLGCEGKKPRKLTRLGDTNWTLADLTFTDGPYLPENGSDTTVVSTNDGGGVGTSVTLTFSSTRGINGGAGFTSNDVGRLVRALRRDTASDTPSYHFWAYFQITGITNSRTVVATSKTDVGYEFGNTKLRTRWRLGAWSDLLGWPSKVALFQGRAWWAQSATYPLTMWASESDQFESYAPTPPYSTVADTPPEPNAANAFFLTLAGGQGNILRWILPLTRLVTASKGDVRSVRGGDLSEVIAFDNAASRNAASVGTHTAPPARIDGAALFISDDRRHVHEVALVPQADNYAVPDVTLWAEHVGQESPLAEIAWQRRPWRVCWARRDDGLLLGFTYDREQDELAWHRHPLGGTDAKVLAMTSIPGDGQDELWLVVERTINGTTRRHVEVLREEQILGQTDCTDFVYLDAGLSYDGSATTTLRGLEHLAGETVQVMADGRRHDDVVVNAIGEVTLTRSASVVHVGYGYTSKIETLPIEAGNPAGSGLGRPKVIHHLTLLLVETVGGKAGSATDKLETIPTLSVGDPSDAPMALKTYRKRLDWNGGYRDLAPLPLVIVQDLPFPMTIAGAVPGYQVAEA